MSARCSGPAPGASPQAKTSAGPRQQKLAGEATRVPDRHPSFHSIPFIATDLGLSKKTIWRWVVRGDLPAYRVGGQFRISDEDYREFLESRRMKNTRPNRRG